MLASTPLGGGGWRRFGMDAMQRGYDARSCPPRIEARAKAHFRGERARASLPAKHGD